MLTETTVKILVVEDDDDLRSTLMDSLRENGFSVESAENGAEGLYRRRRIQGHPPIERSRWVSPIPRPTVRQRRPLPHPNHPQEGWPPAVRVTPMGGLAFFAQYL